jgi:small subunit ribosomal protein S21
MLIIKVDNNNIEKALKTFKYKVNKTKQTKSLRERREYTKPSASKRVKMQKAKYNQQRLDNSQQV